ncbi:MAG: metal ABC transporter ATP-binding protein [bacterium]
MTIEKHQIISGVDFSVKRGETLAIIGPNGAGKSVLFRAILGLIPHSGTITWEEKVKIGYVPQKLSIEKNFPLSVLEFLQFKGNKKDIKDAIESTGINSNILNKKISDISGGELQRIMIAWATIGNPDVLLFDEPLAGIDIGGEETIYNLIYNLNKKRGTTLLMISHDIGVMYKYADMVLCLNKKQMCLGSPKDVINEENETKLYGNMSTFHGHSHEFSKHHNE